MAKKVEFSVEDKLRALYDLQLIDSRIARILAGVDLQHVKEKLILHATSKKMHQNERQYLDGIEREQILEDLQFASIFHTMKNIK